MTNSDTMPVVKQKQSFFGKLFGKKPPELDENGNPVYKKKKKLFKKRVNRSFAGDLTLFLLLLIGGLFMGFPFVYALSNSLKPMNELFLFPPNLIVKNPTFKNYVDLVNIMSNSLVPFSKYLFNTLFITITGTFFNVIGPSLAAYPMSKRKFWGKEFWFKFSSIALMFTTTASIISNYIIMANLGWIDTYYSLLIPALGSSFSLYLIKQYMDGFPDVILESARMDGAGEFRIFFQILMPAIKPGWLTLIVFSVQNFWNTGSTIYIYREELKTLNYALGQIAAAGIARTGVSMAISIVMMILPVFVFVISQSNIIETMATSGMKD